ncbi:Scr1 family TA system antitoxin-like transcriptional regulator [Kitasatospora hibisci]|uniref:DUF397 domain-containing protein n=1 Tax=Kitasatospora hibisci TaxID=3369522 RepID=UPI003753F4B4
MVGLQPMALSISEFSPLLVPGLLQTADYARALFGARPGSVRDSKDPEGPRLRFTPAAWQAFVTAAANGEFGTV